MNLKSRIAGVLATVVLGTSLMGGVALADTNTTSANLNLNPNGVCSAAATTSNVDFGTYQWDGEKYVIVGAPPVLNFKVASTFGPGTGCDVTISASNLQKTGDTSVIISNANLMMTGLTGVGVTPTTGYLAYGFQWVTDGIGDYSGNLKINNTSKPLFEVGSYTGTLTFTATLGTP